MRKLHNCDNDSNEVKTNKNIFWEFMHWCKQSKWYWIRRKTVANFDEQLIIELNCNMKIHLTKNFNWNLTLRWNLFHTPLFVMWWVAIAKFELWVITLIINGWWSNNTLKMIEWTCNVSSCFLHSERVYYWWEFQFIQMF